jgi:glycosyltransferase involved in cell wall biosynthesis
MNTPVISVLVPLYKPDPVFLQEALNSLLTQTEQNWECHICEEPTEANSSDVLEPFLRDSRISYHINEHRLGIGSNWNKCLTYANSPIIAYLFQDDVWDPNYLTEGKNSLEQHESVGFVSMGHTYIFEGDMQTKNLYTDVQTFREESVSPGIHNGLQFLEEWITRELHPNIIGEPSFVMMKKSLMDEVGRFDEDMPQFLDVEYWIRCLLASDWYHCKGQYGKFRVHSDAASARNQVSGEGMFDRLACFQRLIPILPNRSMRHLARKARNRAIIKMTKKFFARIFSGKAILNPFKKH